MTHLFPIKGYLAIEDGLLDEKALLILASDPIELIELGPNARINLVTKSGHEVKENS